MRGGISTVVTVEYAPGRIAAPAHQRSNIYEMESSVAENDESQAETNEERQESNDTGRAKVKTWYPYITKVQFEKFLARLESKMPIN